MKENFKNTAENIREAFNKKIFKDELENYIRNYPVSGFMFYHGDFLKEWITNNDSSFDTFKEIIQLINLTENHFNTKNQNNILNIFFYKKGTLDKNKTLSEITDRNIDRVNKIIKDLENLTIHGEKTKDFLTMMNDFILNPTKYIPTKTIINNDVEQIRQYLKSKNIITEEINNYVEYFQKHFKN